MSHPENSDAASRVSEPRRALWARVLLALVVLFVAVGLLDSWEASEQLFFGWLYFLLRVTPRIRPDWLAIGLGSLAFCICLGLLHTTLCWLVPKRSEGPWPFRATLVIQLTVLLLFVAGTAMVGVTHQLLWLGQGRASPAIQQLEAQDEPAFGVIARWKRERDRTDSALRLRQLGLADHQYHEDSQQRFAASTFDEHGRGLQSWGYRLAPFLGIDVKGVDPQQPWDSAHNAATFRQTAQPFLHPAYAQKTDERGFGASHYAANVYVQRFVPVVQDQSSSHVIGRQPRQAMGMDDITKGTSITLLLGEVNSRFKAWGNPSNFRDPGLGVGTSVDGFGGPPGAGSANFVRVDGSVTSISNNVDPRVMRYLAAAQFPSK